MRRGASWSASVYDYERDEVVDDDIAAMDLKHGRCEIELQTTSPFSLLNWSKHKKTLRHRQAVKQAQAPRVDDASGYAAFAADMLGTRDTAMDDSSAEIRASGAVEARTLIRKMALLVTDQEEDLQLLRDDVAELKEVVWELHDVITAVRQENQVLQKKLQGYEDAKGLSTRGRSLMCVEGTTEPNQIDMFDDNMHLME